MSSTNHRLDLKSIREKLGLSRGKEYWRSLEELTESDGFEDLLHREFPRFASHWDDAVGRRRFLKLMGASLALAGLGACAHQPKEEIVPYIRQPEDMVLGKPLYFATAFSLSGIAEGLLVESHEGRPTKIEGNPDHPASLGSTSAFAQASVLTLYDPDRSQTLTYLGEIRAWSAFVGAVQTALTAKSGGARLRLLTETISSPSLADQIRQLLVQFPAAKWHQYEPVNRDNAQAGSRLAFGEVVNTIYHFHNADVILAIDSDFLSCGPGTLRYVHDFAARRRLERGGSEMNRLYVVESTATNTGAVADHRFRLRPSEIESFARRIAAAVGVQGEVATFVNQQSKSSDWLTSVSRDLLQHRGKSVVIPGDYQSPMVHAVVHAMNHALGNVGSTVDYAAPVEAEPVNQTDSLRELVRDMDSGQVDLLLIVGGNPVYNAPADLLFGERLTKVPLRVHLGLYDDETSALCHWHIPKAHYLESWGDTRAFDGTVSIVQPLIAPLYRGKSAHELLAALLNQPEHTGYEIVRDYWKGQLTANNQDTNPKTTNEANNFQENEFEDSWREALRAGVIAKTALPIKQVSLRTDWSNQAQSTAATSSSSSELEIIFRPEPYIYDGRFANNGWLQELPRPLSKLTWDNAALISPATAERLGLSYEIAARGGEHGEVFADLVELEYQGRKLRTPVWIVPGHADDCLTVHLGYGRTRAGRVASGAGFNAYALRTSDSPWFNRGLTLRKTGEQFALANTQLHYNMEGRELVRSASLAEYLKNPGFAHEKDHAPPRSLSLYPPVEYNGYAWGMAIDLGTCVGCNACVVACQSENNIPIVGKTEVMHGREMHWLRVDRYYEGPVENPNTSFQPVPCMHCENAPCELVCPVGATVHSSEGLNDMVYNRCVGTRYCSNNCPYKVRRFNFLLFQDWDTPSLKMLRNPDVSVRSRGVMEKCTYCVQRINEAKIDAEKENRPVGDGEIVTACQAVCPAQAIVFGDINDPKSRVSQLKAQQRNYGLLEELNTRPRTTYLAAVRNPNPEIREE
jgi:molybdopterin-containing oxidoreductase family iron-sulfur binding subunit